MMALARSLYTHEAQKIHLVKSSINTSFPTVFPKHHKKKTWKKKDSQKSINRKSFKDTFLPFFSPSVHLLATDNLRTLFVASSPYFIRLLLCCMITKFNLRFFFICLANFSVCYFFISGFDMNICTYIKSRKSIKP